MTIPTTEPTSVVAGDTLTWTKSLPDYLPGTWTLKYRLINAAGKFDITATTSGNLHLVTVTSTTSASYTAGDYTWQAWVEKTGERVTVGEGTITVRPNIAALNTLDARTHAAVIRDQLKAAYTAYTVSNGNVSEYEIAGRRMRYRSAAEILTQLNFWEARVNAEKKTERIAAGLNGGGKVMVRF